MMEHASKITKSAKRQICAQIQVNGFATTVVLEKMSPAEILVIITDTVTVITNTII